MIKEEKDSVFRLNDAIIHFNKKTDSAYAAKVNVANMKETILRKDTITIDKELHLNNVQFLTYYAERENKNTVPTSVMYYGFYHVRFLKPIEFTNTLALDVRGCQFEKPVSVTTTPAIDGIINHFEKELNIDDISFQDITLYKSTFNSKVTIGISNHFTKNNLLTNLSLEIDQNVFNKEAVSIDARNVSIFRATNNAFNTQIRTPIFITDNRVVTIENNKFTAASFIVSTKNHTEYFSLYNNTFEQYVKLGFFSLIKDSKIDWKQWNNKVVASGGQTSYYSKITKENTAIRDSLFKIGIEAFDHWRLSEQLVNRYLKESQIIEQNSYAEEIKLRYNFYNFYKDNYDLENANLVYVDIKDLETKRFKYLYDTNPSFKTFFKWRINQFLKIFSNYGKEPEKAVIFSMYVILFFAGIYLLFPNSWDTLGKKRLMHRFEFFQKYLRRKEGMHTLYLEDKQQEISSYEDFKTNLEQTHLEVPTFFITWSKPLYNASMFSSRVTAKFLKTTDVLQGKWQDLSPKQKRWKNIQIGFLLTIGLFYDLFIKVLNALMLSINTFTTLGFGEIPIKGLPRYLAIIQGFIGWFMLTIFSVSLISQLLN